MDHRSFSNMSEKPLRIKGSLIKGLKADLCQFADCPAGDCLVRKLIDLLIFIRVKKSKFYWHLSMGIGIFYYLLTKGVVKGRFCVIKKSDSDLFTYIHESKLKLNRFWSLRCSIEWLCNVFFITY